ncbi:FAD binding domain-containing protein [Coprinopsis cinerea okayama7|uniref:FAD binding domain-containing protein n=1 Tax=Coprinopsis cinerea (strain Okayama-7 / 130 / ATCC MYA-4618 / FGSC 9003) TaxID=240176 RepID=A8P5J4_COPC7|nr:FAD binding domain-containing protein [Coprinopsis cinerea okayama7\|eukprot:XP_001838957.1 FAD binding domain-containing protein [Coprinopsis cinerea okayama7\
MALTTTFLRLASALLFIQSVAALPQAEVEDTTSVTVDVSASEELPVASPSPSASAPADDEDPVPSEVAANLTFAAAAPATLASIGYLDVTYWQGAHYSCKCYPGELCWPSQIRWGLLNAAVDGNLQVVVPDAAVCYNNYEGQNLYDAAACADVQQGWTNEDWVSSRPIAAHWIYWTNTTCMPTDDPNGSCTTGFLPEYVIMAKNRNHVKAGIDFARLHNLRLLIRNTGHDFMGRSSAYGALAINTHSLKEVTFTDRYTGPGDWTGGAVTIGAGVQGRELWQLANQQNPPVAIVTGECPTVGFAGGFIQGGGHGPLSSIYGMAVDNVLSFEVVTADGRFVTANSRHNSELFWALKGGGPSTFAAIISVTVKTFPDTPAAGATFYLNWTHTFDEEVFWQGFSTFHNRANYWVDNGMYAYYELFPSLFRVQPFVAPQKNASALAAIMQPFYDELNALGIPYESQIFEFPTYFDLYTAMFEDELAGSNVIVGGRVFTRSDIEDHADEIIAAKRSIIHHGMIGHIVGPGVGVASADNAVNPAIRQASSFTITMNHATTGMTWDERLAAESYLTDHIDGPLRAASPNGFAYVSEGNLQEPNWQTAYWGSNYNRLRRIKSIWDPLGVFYARTTPGTENWEVIDYGRKLCRKL